METPLKIHPETSRDGKKITLALPEHRYLIGKCLLDRFDKLAGPYRTDDALTRTTDCLGDILLAATRDSQIGEDILDRVRNHFLAEATGQDDQETTTVSLRKYAQLTK